MAADQRRRRLNGSSVAGYSSLEQYRMKKRKLESPQNGLNSNSHISLVWDGHGKQKKVVAKKEQIGISRRNLRPSSNSHSILADVFSIPRETFELEDLTEVLSYEVWRHQLSEDERTSLMQFLPSGQNTEQAVQSLLAGNNFHFGNPFLKWGDSLCSGNLHPDSVLNQERGLKASKKAYYLELQKYHNGMIDYLQSLKDKWEICKDSENEILQKIWRSRGDADKRSSSNANEPRLRDPEQDVTATSESCSLVADEKACSSDNQNSSIMNDGKFNKRMNEKGFMKEKSRSPLIASDDVLNVGTKPKKGEKLNKCNIQPNDGAKYMSYFKISKKQHELVKSMKHSGKSIQYRSLNSVLGNLDMLHVQPYEVFVEEERKKLHDHWLQLANEDLPTFYANWRERKLQLRELTQSLGQEMKSKVKSSMQDEKKEDLCVQDEEKDNLGVQDEGKENSENAPQNENDNAATNHESDVMDEDEYLPALQNQSLRQIASNGSHESDPTDMEPENNHVTAKSDVSSDVSGHSGKINTANDTIHQGVALSFGGNVWPADSRPYSYYDSTANHKFSTSDLPIAHSQVNQDQQTHMIDLKSDMRKDLLHRQQDDGSLSSYQNQDQSELLQSLFKGQGNSAYHHEQKPTGLNFQAPNNVLMADGGQFSGHFQEQLGTSLPLEQGQKRLNEVFMEQNISENIYTDRGGYLIPRHENLQSANMQNWAMNPVCSSEPLQCHLNGGDLLSQNWFPGEHQVRGGGWTGPNGVINPSQNLGIGSNADQSLFNVLSNCNQLRSVNPYDLIGSTEQFISPRNYGLMAGGAPGINPALQRSGHPLDYLGGRDAANSMMPDDISWMNLPHQNSSLHDQMGKPNFRSWNQ